VNISTMARPPSAFRQQDVTRAIRAAKAAGVEIQRIEIASDGRIVIIAAAEAERRQISTPLDAWMAKHGSGQA
jgi:hypothetical protein